MKCFGTSEDDAYFRMRKIVDMIINNADKVRYLNLFIQKYLGPMGDTPPHGF